MTKPAFNALNDWLAWMETLHPSEIDLGLSRIQEVANRLGISSESATVITIAGTNGKGSCVATLEQMLIAAGKTVGAYTSPHILRYNERIKINASSVSDADLCRVFEKINKARSEISLTYFEFGTLAAMLLFQSENVDFWLLEVGLGGRLDAVNIIDPDVAVITSIDMDHEAWLGNTREVIAREKLGVLRPNTPCVCAEVRLTESMTEMFSELNTPLYIRGRDFTSKPTGQGLICSYSAQSQTKEACFPVHPNLPLPSVVAAIQVLALCNIPDIDVLVQSATLLNLSGRFEIVETDVATVILDVAHNPAATKLLAERIRDRDTYVSHAVVAMMSDKNIPATLGALTEGVERWCSTQITEIPRSESARKLAETLVSLGVQAQNIVEKGSVVSALESIFEKILEGWTSSESEKYESSVAQDIKREKPVVLVFGSFYTVAAAHQFLVKHESRESVNG